MNVCDEWVVNHPEYKPCIRNGVLMAIELEGTPVSAEAIDAAYHRLLKRGVLEAKKEL